MTSLFLNRLTLSCYFVSRELEYKLTRLEENNSSWFLAFIYFDVLTYKYLHNKQKDLWNGSKVAKTNWEMPKMIDFELKMSILDYSLSHLLEKKGSI